MGICLAINIKLFVGVHVCTFPDKPIDLFDMFSQLFRRDIAGNRTIRSFFEGVVTLQVWL